MSLRSPSGVVFYGNQKFVTSESNSAYPQVDRNNNAERVVVPPASATAGVWAVRIRGSGITKGPQKVSIPPYLVRRPAPSVFLHSSLAAVQRGGLSPFGVMGFQPASREPLAQALSPHLWGC